MDTEPTLPGAAPLERAPVRAQGTPAEGRDALNEDSDVKKKPPWNGRSFSRKVKLQGDGPTPWELEGQRAGREKISIKR